MVEIARSRGLTVHLGDMTTFDLGRTFDVVTCLFSSIGYAADLGRTVANLARHVAPGGVLVIEPWLTPETVIPDHVSLQTADDGVTRVARMGLVRVEGGVSRLNLHHLVGGQGKVDYFQEQHDLRLWTRDEYEAALVGAGLVPTYDGEGLMGRGLWLGVRSA